MNLVMKKNKLIFIIINFVLLLILSYFLYNSFVGNRGYFEYKKLQKIIKEKEIKLHSLKEERGNLESKTSILYNENISNDFLDELSRKHFSLKERGEICLELKN
jgi:cell division protein FtsB